SGRGSGRILDVATETTPRGAGVNDVTAVMVDTDVASFTFKKDTRAARFRRHLTGRSLLLSFMTLAELHAWGLRHRWGQTRRDQLARHLGRYGIHYPDPLTCELWAA